MDNNKATPLITKNAGPANRSLNPGLRPQIGLGKPTFNPKAPTPPVKGAEAAKVGSSHAESPIQPGLDQLLDNGFTPQESGLIHDSLRGAGMKWFDGDGCILGRGDQIELAIRSGSSERQRWAVMAVPIYDMNAPGAVEIALHFLAESFDMAHILDFQYQIAINMETERLEFLMNIPIEHLTVSQVSEIISTFTKAMMESLTQELSALLDQMGPQKT